MVAIRLSIFLLIFIIKDSVSLKWYDKDSCAELELRKQDCSSINYPFRIGCGSFSIGYYKYKGCVPYIFSDQCKVELQNSISLLTNDVHKQELIELNKLFRIAVGEQQFNASFNVIVCNDCNMCSEDFCNSSAFTKINLKLVFIAFMCSIFEYNKC